MTKGGQAERDLAEWGWNNGYATLRAPGSGTVNRPSPDVVFTNADATHAIELKCSPDGTATLDREEIGALGSWAGAAAATPWVLVKPDLRTFDHWLCYPVARLHETPEGNFSVRKADHDVALSRTEAFL